METRDIQETARTYLIYSARMRRTTKRTLLAMTGGLALTVGSIIYQPLQGSSEGYNANKIAKDVAGPAGMVMMATSAVLGSRRLRRIADEADREISRVSNQ